jgi:hypothetical protein
MEDNLQFLLTCLEATILSYLIVWSVHNTDVFHPIRMWAQQGLNFLHRAVGCSVCFTYHVSLAVTSLVALVNTWSLFTWIMGWGLVCFGSLWMNTHNILRYPEEAENV